MIDSQIFDLVPCIGVLSSREEMYDSYLYKTDQWVSRIRIKTCYYVEKEVTRKTVCKL